MSLGRGVCWEQITGGNCEYNNAKIQIERGGLKRAKAKNAKRKAKTNDNYNYRIPYYCFSSYFPSHHSSQTYLNMTGNGKGEDDVSLPKATVLKIIQGSPFARIC